MKNNILITAFLFCFVSFSANAQLSLSVTADTICQGDSVMLTATGGSNYRWSNGSTNVPSITVAPSATTIYTVTGKVGAADQSQNSIITVIPIQANAVYQEGSNNTVVFNNVSINSTGNVFWWFGDGEFSTLNDPTHSYFDPGQYAAFLVIENSYGCVDTIHFIVGVGHPVFVPSAFTPNGDLKNDTFYPKAENFTSVNMKVFDRWGTVVFDSPITDNPESGWNGYHFGRACKQDVYAYKIKVTYPNGEDKDIHGKVALIR